MRQAMKDGEVRACVINVPPVYASGRNRWHESSNTRNAAAVHRGLTAMSIAMLDDVKRVRLVMIIVGEY